VLGGKGAIDTTTMAKIKRAAELVTTVEMMRAKLLRGEPVDQLALSRLQGCSDRAIRALGKPVKAAFPDISDLTRGRRP